MLILSFNLSFKKKRNETQVSNTHIRSNSLMLLDLSYTIRLSPTSASVYTHPCLCFFYSAPAKAMEMNQLGLHAGFHALPWVSTFWGQRATVSVLGLLTACHISLPSTFSINLLPIFLFFMIQSISYRLFSAS